MSDSSRHGVLGVQLTTLSFKGNLTASQSSKENVIYYNTFTFICYSSPFMPLLNMSFSLYVNKFISSASCTDLPLAKPLY
jgi:hypothetical protein